MTIGPEPMTITLFISFLLGIFTLLHYFGKLLEQIAAILRARGTLGVVLHRKDAVLGALHALGRAVEQVYVRQPEAGGVRVSPVPFSDSVSTAKLWFWLVISIRPVSRFFTGWFPPRWPNFIFTVLAP